MSATTGAADLQIPDRLFVSVPEAAAVLRVDQRTLRRELAAGTIPSTRVGPVWRIPTSWLRQQAQGAA